MPRACSPTFRRTGQCSTDEKRDTHVGATRTVVIHGRMTRTLGYVPVRVGRDVVPVAVEAEQDAQTHVDVLTGGARIVVAAGLSAEVANREVEIVLPEVQRILARKLLN